MQQQLQQQPEVNTDTAAMDNGIEGIPIPLIQDNAGEWVPEIIGHSIITIRYHHYPPQFL